jgi:hypothetical protein
VYAGCKRNILAVEERGLDCLTRIVENLEQALAAGHHATHVSEKELLLEYME